MMNCSCLTSFAVPTVIRPDSSCANCMCKWDRSVKTYQFSKAPGVSIDLTFCSHCAFSEGNRIAIHGKIRACGLEPPCSGVARAPVKDGPPKHTGYRLPEVPARPPPPPVSPIIKIKDGLSELFDLLLDVTTLPGTSTSAIAAVFALRCPMPGSGILAECDCLIAKIQYLLDNKAPSGTLSQKLSRNASASNIIDASTSDNPTSGRMMVVIRPTEDVDLTLGKSFRTAFSTLKTRRRKLA